MQVGSGPFKSGLTQYFPLESVQGVPQGLLHLVSDLTTFFHLYTRQSEELK